MCGESACALMYLCVCVCTCASVYGMHMACYLRAFPQVPNLRVSFLAPFSVVIVRYFWPWNPFFR